MVLETDIGHLRKRERDRKKEKIQLHFSIETLILSENVLFRIVLVSRSLELFRIQRIADVPAKVDFKIITSKYKKSW